MALCGQVGFCFADFAFREPGTAAIDVEGAQVGVCLDPRGVTIERERERIGVDRDAVIVRNPGSTSRSAWREGFHGHYLFYAPEAIERFFHLPMSRIRFGRDLVEAATQKPVVAHLIAAAALDLEADSPSGPVVMESLSAAALRSFATDPSEPGKVARGLSNEQAKILRDLILERLQENLSLTVLAEAVGLSVGHMLRSFKLTFGVTPHQYIIRERVEHAVRCLKTKPASLADVARESGFTNRAQMARSFRAVLGILPSGVN